MTPQQLILFVCLHADDEKKALSCPMQSFISKGLKQSFTIKGLMQSFTIEGLIHVTSQVFAPVSLVQVAASNQSLTLALLQLYKTHVD